LTRQKVALQHIEQRLILKMPASAAGERQASIASILLTDNAASVNAAPCAL
jgi:hypothetical protein